jgi:hypothetical protein
LPFLSHPCKLFSKVSLGIEMGAYALILLKKRMFQNLWMYISDQGLGTFFIHPLQDVPGGLDTNRALDPVEGGP